MSAPFPEQDFLDGNWRPLSEIARKTEGGIPAGVPALDALDFDRVKNSVCAFRGWGLCSVDAVTIAEDGRVYLIEFKDTSRNPISWLRKKGFDSLLLLWIAIGQGLTMDEIRDRSVFCYVHDIVNRYDDDLNRDLQEASGYHPVGSMPDQLEELYASGLYGEVRHLGFDEFAGMINGIGASQSVCEFKNRIPLRYSPQQPRPNVPQVRDGLPDLKACLAPIAELRMCYPFDQQMHRKHPNEILWVADSYDGAQEIVSWHHDWGLRFPVMRLTACCFDSFAFWCLAYHAGDRLETLGARLKGLITFGGEAPQTLQEPQNTSHDAYRHRFWEVYARHFSLNFGLSRLEQEHVYGKIDGEFASKAEAEE